MGEDISHVNETYEKKMIIKSEKRCVCVYIIIFIYICICIKFKKREKQSAESSGGSRALRMINVIRLVTRRRIVYAYYVI